MQNLRTFTVVTLIHACIRRPICRANIHMSGLRYWRFQGHLAQCRSSCCAEVAFFLICSQPIDSLDYMYPSSDKETRIEWKKHNGKGRRECSWKHLIAIASASKCRSTLIPSPHHPITYTIITPLLVRLQQPILTSTKQLGWTQRYKMTSLHHIREGSTTPSRRRGSPWRV